MKTLDICREIINNENLLKKLLSNLGKTGTITLTSGVQVRAKSDLSKKQYSNPLELIEDITDIGKGAVNHTLDIDDSVVDVIAIIADTEGDIGKVKCLNATIRDKHKMYLVPRIYSVDIEVYMDTVKTKEKKESRSTVSLLDSIDDIKNNIDKIKKSILNDNEAILGKHKIIFDIETYQEELNKDVASFGLMYRLSKDKIKYEKVEDIIVTENKICILVQCDEETTIYQATVNKIFDKVERINYTTDMYYIKHKERFMGVLGQQVCTIENSGLYSHVSIGDIIVYRYNDEIHKGIVVISDGKVSVLNTSDESILDFSNVERIDSVLKYGKDIVGNSTIGNYTRILKIE